MFHLTERKCLLPMRIFNDKWRALITKPQLSKKEQITYREFEPKNPKFKKRSDYRLGISSFNLNFTDLICHPITIFSIGIRSLKIDQNELNYKYEQRTVIPIQSIKVLILKVIYPKFRRKIPHNVKLKYSSQKDPHRVGIYTI